MIVLYIIGFATICIVNSVIIFDNGVYGVRLVFYCDEEDLLFYVIIIKMNDIYAIFPSEDIYIHIDKYIIMESSTSYIYN